MPYFSFEKPKKSKKVVYGIVRNGHYTKYGYFSKFGNSSAIYGIKCKITNKVYIGATKYLQRRLLKHFSELHLNRHRCKEFQKDYNLYGKDEFDIIIYDENIDNLLEVERNKQIELGVDNIYNEKISNYWIHPDYRDKLANSDKTTHKTKEYRNKMSKLKTNKVAQYTLSMELIKVWDSAIEICETLGHTRSVILSCCNGSKLRAYGYNWRYVDDNGNIIHDGYAKGRKKI